MAGRWKERLKKLARANEKARESETKRLTLDRAARVLEGLLSDPPAPPVPRPEHPVSSTRRIRRKDD